MSLLKYQDLKGLRLKHTFLGGHDFYFCYMFKTILLGTTKFGKRKKVAPESPSWLWVSTNLISLFYKLIYGEPQNANNNIKHVHRHIGMCQ